MRSGRIFLYTMLVVSLGANVLFTCIYLKRKHMYHKEHNDPVNRQTIAFVGNSITARFPLNELMPGHDLVNKGISANQTNDILDRINDIVKGKPKAIFLMAGINDIIHEIPFDTIAGNYRKIIDRIGDTKLYIQSVLPLAHEYAPLNATINRFNDTLKAICLERHITYLPINELFIKDGALDPAYTDDGIHLLPSAYPHWAAYLKPMLEKIDGQ